MSEDRPAQQPPPPGARGRQRRAADRDRRPALDRGRGRRTGEGVRRARRPAGVWAGV